MSTMLATLPGNVLDPAKRPLFILLLGFILAFTITRIRTRRTRARGQAGTGAGSIVTPGGLHIHHSVFGIVGMVVFGILEFALRPGSPWVELIALCFGAGAALTLDEFALILHLDDVYWTGEGRASIDAVILGITFMTLLLTGLLPKSITEFGGVLDISRWVGVALILSSAVFVVVSYLKGKLFMGTVGIFVPPIAVIGALRLARPNSPWAHREYARNPAKLERAQGRQDGFNRRWRERKHQLWDAIGGKPHLRLPHRHEHHDDHDEGPAQGSSRSQA